MYMENLYQYKHKYLWLVLVFATPSTKIRYLYKYKYLYKLLPRPILYKHGSQPAGFLGFLRVFQNPNPTRGFS